MAKFMLLLCVVALFSGVSFAEEEEDFVVTLGDDNLTSALEEDPDKIWLVEWYAPWCGHCKQLKPEYEEASRQLHSSTPSVALAAIDATVHSETAGEHDVQGYPTLKVFRNGKSYDYEGGRQAADIVSYMKKQASPDWKPPADRVVKLTNDNFDAFVDNEEIALVYFYAPWCGHCKQLTPEYEKAARDLYTNNPRIKLAKVDATEETELASRFDVTGYPTLKIFRKGEASDYEGERQQHAIVSEMKEQAQPPAKVINSVFDMDEFVKGDGDSVQLVAFLDDEAGSDADKWQRIASPLRKAYRFAISTSAAVRDKYKNAKPGRVVLFQPPKYHSKLEPAAVATELSKLATADDLSAWIEKRAVPLVGHRTRSSKYTGYNFAERMPQLVMYYKVDFGSALFKDTAYWRERLSTVAKDFSAINFMISDEEEFEQDLKDVGRLGSDDEFTVVLYDGSKRYLMEEDMEMDAVREFVEAYEEGELKPYIKSAPVPRHQDGHVVQVVGKTFETVVQDDSKDVLIEMYATWCGHCKALAPTYAKLAKKLRKVDDLVIAKIEATENDVPEEYAVEGFPTIYFKPKGQGSTLIKYEEQGREVDDFLKFLRKHASARIPKFKKKAKTKEEL